MRISQILFTIILVTFMVSGTVWADSLNVSGVGVFRTDWGWARSVVKAGDYAYVADQGNAGMHILNVSNSAMPMEVGRIRELGGIKSLAVAGTYLYLAADSADLAIFDITDPAHPALQCRLGAGSGVSSLKAVFPYVYCAFNEHEGTNYAPALVIIDVSNPTQPPMVTTLSLASYGSATAVDVVGSNAYVAGENGDADLTVVDISNPSQPAILGSCSINANHSHAVTVGGNYAYVCCGGAGMVIVDVSNPGTPTVVRTMATRDWAMELVLHGNYGYLADDAAGLSILDMTNPAQPTLLGQLGTYDWAEGITYADPYVYLTAGSSGLHIVDVSDPNTPVRLSQIGERGLSTVAVAGTYAYVSSGEEVNLLNVLNVADPAHPTEVTLITTAHTAKRLIISGNFLYAMDDFGMQVVSLANLAAPVIVGTLSAGFDDFIGMQVNGNYVYLGLFGGSAEVVDVSNPTAPSVVGSCTVPGNVHNVTASGSMLYVLNEHGLALIDATNPQAPVLRGTCQVSGDWAVVSGHYVYVSGAAPDADYMLYVIDVSDAEHPVIVGSQMVGWYANGMTISGTWLYVAAENQGVRVFDLQDPLHPEEAGFYDSDTELFYSAKGVALGNGLIYATSYYELATLRFEPHLGHVSYTVSPVSEFALQPAYPNPFNNQTRLAFSLPSAQPIQLTVYDMLGREVRRVAQGVYPAGRHEIFFDASALSSGVYFVRLNAPHASAIQKVMLLK